MTSSISKSSVLIGEIRHILDLSGEQYQLIKQVFDEEGYLEHP
jgi:hypothetical protein